MSRTGRWIPFPAVMTVLCALLLSCGDAPASPQEAAAGELGPIASIIRNPVDQGVTDTVNVARLSFAEPRYEFGEVRAGRVVRHDFSFTNTGKVPLLITNARSTCGCTVPSYPREPIQPGESGVIAVAFDTKNKGGYQSKPIQILANTYPAQTTIYVSGRVQ